MIVIALVLAYALPFAINTFTLSVLLIYGMLGLSLGLIWGFGGILCFGQTAFFGLDRKSTRLNSSHSQQSRMPSSA